MIGMTPEQRDEVSRRARDFIRERECPGAVGELVPASDGGELVIVELTGGGVGARRGLLA